MVVLRNLPVEAVVGANLQAAVTMKASSGDYHSLKLRAKFYFYLSPRWIYLLVFFFLSISFLQVTIIVDVMLLVPS